MKPYFTILIDNYNHGDVLADCVRSALGQDFPAAEREVLVVDDGSTDSSREVLASFKDAVRTVLQPNQGQTAALNRGMAEARGEVVCLLDADDVADRERLKVMAECFRDPSISAAQGFLAPLSSDGRPIAERRPDWPELYTLEQFLDHQCHWSATSAIALRKESADRFLPATLEFRHFYLDSYYLVASLLNGPIRCLQRALGYFRPLASHTCNSAFEAPKTLAWETQMRRLFLREVAARFAQRGVELPPRFFEAERKELLQREVLLAAFESRPRALAAWWGGARRAGLRRAALFHSATMALAVLSPRLYAKLFGVYNSHPEWGRWRQKLLP